MGSPIELQAGDINQLPPALSGLVEHTSFVTAPPYVGPDGRPAIASVDPGNPDTVDVEEPDTFRSAEPQLVGHELTHIWQNNLPPTVQKEIPADSPDDKYNLSNLDTQAAQGATMETIPHEEAATITQKYIAGNEAVKKRLQPWMDQMDDAPLSSLMPTAPDAKTINTTSRPPTPADALRYEDQVKKEVKAAATRHHAVKHK